MDAGHSMVVVSLVFCHAWKDLDHTNRRQGKTLLLMWIAVSLVWSEHVLLYPYGELYTTLFLYMPALLKALYLQRSILILIFLMGVGLIWNLPFSLLCILCFRWVVLLSNLKMLFQSQSNRCRIHFFFCCASHYSRHTIRSSYIDHVWSEECWAANKDIVGLPKTVWHLWRSLGNQWKGHCRFWGSSTGGIYQFKKNRHLFPRISQQSVSKQPSLQNTDHIQLWCGRLQSQLIADQGKWLKEEHNPDLLVLYVGVNDVLSKHHTQSIKERRQSTVSPWLKISVQE